MKICHYNNHQAGVIVGNKVVNIANDLIQAGLARQGYTMLEIIDALANNPQAMQIAKQAETSPSGEDLLSVKLLAPITKQWELQFALRELAVSAGSACSSASEEASYVLRALGRSDQLAQSSLRFSLGRFTTPEQIETAIAAVKREVTRLRSYSPQTEKKS